MTTDTEAERLGTTAKEVTVGGCLINGRVVNRPLNGRELILNPGAESSLFRRRPKVSVEPEVSHNFSQWKRKDHA